MYKLFIIIGRVVAWCVSPASHFVLRRTKRAYALLVVGDEVLLIKNWLGSGEWRLPGGGIHRGETAEETIVRELREELSIDVDNDLPNPVWLDDMIGFKYACFLLCLDTKPNIKKRATEITEYRWFPLSLAAETLSKRDGPLASYLLQ